MTTFWKAVLQGGVGGLVIGLVLLVGGKVWQPQRVAAQGAPGAPVQDTVRAKRLEIVDDAGQTRIVLSLNPNGIPGLTEVPEGSPSLALLDEKGKERALLSVDTDGSTGLALYDENEKTRAALSVFPDGTSGLALRDKGEKVRVVLTVLPEESPRLVLSDKDGKERAILFVSPEGAPAMALFDKDETGRAFLGTSADGRPALSLRDENGKTLWRAP